MPTLHRFAGTLLFASSLTLVTPTPAAAAEWFVAAGGSGDGSAGAPFGRIQDGLAAAQPGDIVTVAAGTYTEALKSVRSGTASQPIVLRAASGRGSVLVTVSGRVLTVAHAYLTVQGLVLDGRFGPDDIVRIGSAGNGFTLRDSEVRRTSKDAIDMAGPADVLIEGSLIHRALNATDGRTDAHGIAAGPVSRLTVRNTEIHTFSGDAIQVDPGRSSPGWSDVTIEGCRLWLAPLAAAENGFAGGTVPGENALDTKASAGLPRARITIRDTEAFGFAGGLISNMAAFNLKEHIEAVVDRVTVHKSEIAFRMRGAGTEPTGAHVHLQNAVVHGTTTAFRYEDNLQNLRIWNSTVGGGVTRAFQAASSAGSTLEVRNLMLLGATLSAEASHPSNLAVPASAFVNAASHDYQLASGSPAVDAGVSISGLTSDRLGISRPQGPAYDVGAYERLVSSPIVNPDPSAGSEIALHTWKTPLVVGNWAVVPDVSAAGGARVASMNEGAPALGTSQAKNPASYFELTFPAQSSRAYRLWVRGRAAGNDPLNDSVYVQFSNSVDAAGTPLYRIGTKGVTTVSLSRCSSCTLSGWGWQDNGTGVSTPGPLVYFAKSGEQRIRVMIREDGMSIDQIVLSPAAYLTTAPGSLRNDATILPATN